jgi:hypothetical protein
MSKGRWSTGRQLPKTLQYWRDTLLSFEVDVTLAALQAPYGIDGHDMLLKMLPDEAAQRRKALLKAQGSALRETI